MKPISNFFILLAFSFQSLNAQSPQAKLDSFFNSKVANAELSSSVLVAENGRVLVKRNMGYADFQAKKEITDVTRFQFASISKTMTAIAVLQLMERES